VRGSYPFFPNYHYHYHFHFHYCPSRKADLAAFWLPSYPNHCTITAPSLHHHCTLHPPPTSQASHLISSRSSFNYVFLFFSPQASHRPIVPSSLVPSSPRPSFLKLTGHGFIKRVLFHIDPNNFRSAIICSLSQCNINRLVQPKSTSYLLRVYESLPTTTFTCTYQKSLGTSLAKTHPDLHLQATIDLSPFNSRNPFHQPHPRPFRASLFPLPFQEHCHHLDFERAQL
jgi:hypothetical protein